jgi:tetratricopeptide (TPR) repeat protein
MNKILFIILLTFSLLSKAQDISTNNKLALEYYRNHDFEKALVLYKQLFTQTNSQHYLTYYVQCMIELKEFEAAEKDLKKRIKQNKYALNYYVELGSIYKAQGLEDKANEQYELATKKLQGQQNVISSLANAFIYKREYEWAEKTYLKGRKLMKGTYPFNYELANIYFYQRDYDKMITEYLSLLDINQSYLSSVQNRLQSIIYNDKDGVINNILKKNLISKIQKNSKNDVYQELLIWLYTQENDFHNASIQSKALDKRYKGEGERLLILGNLSAKNKDFKTSEECYNYIISLGEKGIYYTNAKSELTEIMFQMFLESHPTNEKIDKLDLLFTETLNELGKTSLTYNTIINSAKLKAFYKNDYTSSINILENAIKMSGIKPAQIAEAKLTLGDIYLLKQEDWNATIYYAQVEQDFKTNPIGHEARFKKAKLAYFTGNFRWAQAQLNVLKAATSKLIANDAFQLSSLISANLENDSTGNALKLYSRADFLVYAKNDSLAFLTLDSIQELYPSNSLIDEVLFMKGDIEYREGNFEKSLEFYSKVSENYAFDILADNALFKQAEINLYKLQDKEAAMEFFKRIMIEYPDSYYSTEAREKYRELRGDKLENPNSLNRLIN